MSPRPILFAPPVSAAFGGSLPGCLHPVLGDPALLWVLRALPESQIPALLIHGETDIAEAAAKWSAEGLLPCPVLSIQVPVDTHEAMLLAAQHAVSPLAEDGVGLLMGDAPLVDPRVVADLLTKAPLSWDALMDALQRGVRLDGESLGPWHDFSTLRMTTRQALAHISGLARTKLCDAWMAQGVSIPEPAACTIGPRVTLAQDVTVERGVCLEGTVVAGEGTRFGQGSVFTDCSFGAHVDIRPYCVGTHAQVGSRVRLGPFAHLREGTVLEAEVHIGNFVETKKTLLKRGAKANHLSYLGDAEIGEGTNIGAGCITCNYDGVRKHRTLIGPRAFVGSDCQLVAPVTLGEGCLVAAGTTVTRDVPPDAIAIARPAMSLREGAARRLREKLKAASS